MAEYIVHNLKSTVRGNTSRRLAFEMELNGSAMNLTGATITATFFLKGNPELILTETSGITVTDAANGLFEIPSFKVTLKAGGYDYEIVFVFSDGKERKYIVGNWVIIEI